MDTLIKIVVISIACCSCYAGSGGFNLQKMLGETKAADLFNLAKQHPNLNDKAIDLAIGKAVYGDLILEDAGDPLTYYKSDVKAQEMIANIDARADAVKEIVAKMEEGSGPNKELSNQLVDLLKKVEELYVARKSLDVTVRMRPELEQLSIDSVLKDVGYEGLKRKGLLNDYNACDWIIQNIRFLDISARKYMAVQDDFETTMLSIQQQILRQNQAIKIMQISQANTLKMLALFCDATGDDNQPTQQTGVAGHKNEYDYLDGVGDLFQNGATD